MNKRTLRYITKALEASLDSNYPRIKIGAIIVDGNYVVSSAANQARTHPFQYQLNRDSLRDCPNHYLHAEVHALVRSKAYDLSDSEIFVARYLRDGSLGDCRPCPSCTLALGRAGIRRATYTTPSGIRQMGFR